MEAKNCNKIRFITLNKQWVYLCIGQKLKNAAYIYSPFINTVFGPLLKAQKISQMPVLINVYKEDLFSIYIDNHIRIAKLFEVIYTFLHNNYFPRVVFGLIY